MQVKDNVKRFEKKVNETVALNVTEHSKYSDTYSRIAADAKPKFDDPFAVSSELCEMFLGADNQSLDALYETSTVSSTSSEDSPQP